MEFLVASLGFSKIAATAVWRIEASDKTSGYLGSMLRLVHDFRFGIGFGSTAGLSEPFEACGALERHRYRQHRTAPRFAVGRMGQASKRSLCSGVGRDGHGPLREFRQP